MQNEQELVGRVVAGDPDAEEEFFALYRPRLYRASMYFLGSRDAEAEDIVQETFLIAIPKLQHYVFKAPIYAWLRQICLRLCYARTRTRSRLLPVVETDMELYLRRQAFERVQKDDLDELKERRLEILRSLNGKLPPVSRRVIELRNKGLSYSSISEELKLPLGTVMSRLNRAKEQIKKMVERLPVEELV